MDSITVIAAHVLSLMLGFRPGQTNYSRHEVAEGTPGAVWETCYAGGWRLRGNKKTGIPKPQPCRPYRPGSARGAWVLVETREQTAERLRPAAVELAAAAHDLLPSWKGPDGERGFATAMTTAAGWSTGFREDIQMGRARGPDGEVCFADMTLPTLRQFSAPELQALPDGELALKVVGRGPAELRLCFDALARGFANAYAKTWVCRWPNEQRITRAFGVYAAGDRCPPMSGWMERKRTGTYQKYIARDEPLFPVWYLPPPIADSLVALDRAML